MKKQLLLILFAMTMAFAACAQEYRKFKFGVGLSGAKLNKDYGAGFIALEPSYRLSDALAVGLRVEVGLLSGAPGGIDAVGAMASAVPNVQYYLSNKAFRPFVGGGAGVYAYGAVAPKFGYYPRIGFEVTHFYMSFDYNIIPGTSQSYEYDLTKFPHLTIGGYFGGGKK